MLNCITLNIQLIKGRVKKIVEFSSKRPSYQDPKWLLGKIQCFKTMFFEALTLPPHLSGKFHYFFNPSLSCSSQLKIIKKSNTFNVTSICWSNDRSHHLGIPWHNFVHHFEQPATTKAVTKNSILTHQLIICQVSYFPFPLNTQFVLPAFLVA